MIDLIGVPFDLCGKRRGSALGPAAIRYAGVEEALVTLGLDVRDRGDVGSVRALNSERLRGNFVPVLEVISRLRVSVTESLTEGRFPLILGGEHTIVTGSIAAALQVCGEELAVVWIDAHADVNNPGSSTTGNLHGMPLAALAGLPSDSSGRADAEWSEFVAALGPSKLSLARTAWYGIRDVDPAERSRLLGRAITIHDIDRRGIVHTVAELDEWLRKLGAKHVWISFDVDALDPILAPGTGTAVRGGLTYREAHLFAELLHEILSANCPYALVGLDVVETNPLADINNQTAVLAVEWIASLFGKSIL